MEGRAEYQANEKVEILSFSLEDNRILCDMKSEGRVLREIAEGDGV